MKASLFSIWGRLLALTVVFGSAGCGSGGGGGSSGAMAIASCSLQCNDSAINAQISCGVTNVAVNQEIRLTFTNAIDPTTVTNNTFQLTESGSGRTPAGGFGLDPQDPRTLIYRPQLTFDSAGNPVFGLTQDRTYLLKVPGIVLDPLGPYIRNTNGSPNTSRLLCTLIASEDPRDSNPGRPRVAVSVFRKDNDGDPSDGDFVRVGEDDDGFPIPGQTIGGPRFFNALGLTRVHRDTPVRFVFDDVMNPATLANPVTGSSSTIQAFVDADGDTTDRSDQVPMQGVFTVTIDQNAVQTTVVFQPSGGLPSAGADDANPRKVVVELSPQIADLGRNTLVNAGTLSFTPEKLVFGEITIEESFSDLTREDALRTGSDWGPDLLATGPGGGSGRLGDLVVLPGTVVVLDTDSEDFTDITNPASFNPIHIIDRSSGTPALPVTNGVFEFSRLRVDAGGVLRFRGSRPARVYVRGVADIAGLIDVSGSSGILHTSDELLGGVGGIPGPNGGAGGRGGSRPDGSAFTGTFGGFPIGGVANPGVGPSDVLDPATYVQINGIDGGGIPFPSTIDPAPIFVAGGQAGLAWPQPTSLFPGLHMPQDVNDVSGLVYDPLSLCTYPVPSSPGGGGAHALDGGLGDMTLEPRTPMPIPADSEGGSSDDLQIDDVARTLSPELGLLRGGGGGGGAGGHLQFTGINAVTFMNCTTPVGGPAQISSYVAHSSAGGGGGGGGLQLAAGRRVILSGVIDASGGDGGSGTFPPDADTPLDLTQAGGGGAGGSVLLQAERVQIQAVPGRLKIDGGDGGEGSGNPPGTTEARPSAGGRGSPGFLRIETPVPAEIANEEAKVDPTESELQESYGPGVVIEDILSTAAWQPTTEPPSSWSGAQSCWIRPSGNFFRLTFTDDANVPCEPGHAGLEPGWDMRLRIAGQANPQSFRGPNDIAGIPLEQLFGADFGASPVIVRFQGARAVGTLTDPCSVPETGGSSPLSAASISEWVCHPALLNDFFEDESLSPNIFRFVILWDRSQPDFAGIEGVEDVTITIQPD